MADVCDLTNKQCKPCEGGVPPLSQDEINRLLGQLDGWTQHGPVIDKPWRGCRTARITIPT